MQVDGQIFSRRGLASLNSGKTWRIYDCDIVDMAKLYPEAAGLPKAIAIHGEGPYREAEGLPKGFVTKVLLDYDFSDDGQVLAFVREYGPVVCPYGGTMFRTAMAIGDPRYYPDMLRRASFMRGGEERGHGRLHRGRRLRVPLRVPRNVRVRIPPIGGAGVRPLPPGG